MMRLSKCSLSEEEQLAVARVLQREYLGMGSEVQAFEKELQAFFASGVEVVCVNNGTGALQLALQAAGVSSGDEVLIPTLTYVASFQAVSALGATPIACDVQVNNGLLDLKDAATRLTNRTKAIMPVHYASNAGELNAIYHFASVNNLRVIEDAAHAFGTTYQGELIGAQGDIVCFSFDGIKNITSGEGGAVVTKDQAVLDKVRDLRLLGVMKDSEKRYNRQRSWEFDVCEQGWRYHMSDIMAAIGRVQLRRFNNEFKPKRKELLNVYRDLLSNLSGVALLEVSLGNDVVPHIMPIRVLNKQRDKLKAYLSERKIPTGIHYKPNHLLKKYSSSKGHLPIAERLYQELITLPLHASLSILDLEMIVNTIKLFMKGG